MKYFDIGKPFNTEAVINYEHIQVSESIKPFDLKRDESIVLTYKMAKDEIIYGLGENMRGINKRGGIYESFCSDDPTHLPDRKSLYGAHNFFLIDGIKSLGIFIDFPSKVTFDMGFTHPNEMVITIHGLDARVFLIEGSKNEIVHKFLKAIGPSYLPPKWAFGYQQSRWSYETADKIKEIKDTFNEKDMPLDTIYMDIDYMDDFKNFTISEERFPNFKNFVQEMKADGIRLIPIIDAGCKIEKDYEIYEEGIENNYYCLNEKGQPFVGAVWPGKVHFPDFLNQDARRWFGDHYSKLVDLGIDGFWNDMNEPAIFYSENGLNEAIDYAINSKGKNLGIYDFFTLKDKFMAMANNDQDYKAFYHQVDGKRYNHYDLHNLYGYNMTRAAGEGFLRNYPDKRILMFSRASYIGMHRYGGIWTGDNHAWWEHLLLNIKMMPSLNMCGFKYSGADIGGFGAHSSSELLIRWSQFAMFTPLFRNHSAMGTRIQEPVSFDDETVDTLRHILKFRNALVSHIYSQFMMKNKTYEMLFKPLSFEYDDPASKNVEDQILFGDLMLMPVYEANAKGRYVYLPKDYVVWRIQSFEDYRMDLYMPGHHYIEAELNETIIGLKKDCLILLNQPENRVDDISLDRMTCIGYIENEASYQLYSDDGETFEEGQTMTVTITYDKQLEFSVENPLCKEIVYDVMTSDNRRHKGVYHV